MNQTNNSPDEYLRKPYSRILIPDEESGTFSAEVLEFPGCVAQGDTPQEAYANLERAAEGWVQAALDLGQPIPPPSISQGYGGKIALRLPRSLHRRAVSLAERDGTSLNQFLVMAIAERVGTENIYAQMTQRLEQRLFQTTVTTVGNLLQLQDYEIARSVGEPYRSIDLKAGTPTSVYWLPPFSSGSKEGN